MMKQPHDLTAKVALVSGAAGGLGEAICAALHSAGACVMIADIRAAQAEQLAGRFTQRAASCQLDVTDEASWEAAVATTIAQFGGLDIVVNNAGFESGALITECELSDFRQMMEVNAVGVFLGTKHAMRAMRPGGAAGKGGAIINTVSAAAKKAPMFLAAYSASKGAVRQFTQAAAVEAGRLGYGIRVNGIYPGLIKTAMGIKTLQGYVDAGVMASVEQAEEAFVAGHPLGLGQPQDIANGVCYLASDAARWITGAELSIDGGFTAA